MRSNLVRDVQLAVVVHIGKTPDAEHTLARHLMQSTHWQDA